MRRPADHPDDLERGRDASVIISIQFLVPGSGGEKCVAAKTCAAARGHRIGLTHAPQFMHQRKHVRVGDGDGVRIDDGQRKPRSLQQRADIGDICDRRGVWAGAAGGLGLGFQKGAA